MIQLYRSFTNKLKRDDISAHAASAAFFIFLSIFPMLMMVSSILPYTHITESDLMTIATDILPTNIDPLAVSIINEMYDKSVAIISVSAVFAIWSASKGMLALLRGLNSVEEVDETRNYFILRLRSSFYTVIVLGVLVFSMVVIVFGNSLVQTTIRRMPHMKYFVDLLMSFRYLFFLTLMVVVFACMYAYIPNQKQKLYMKLPGAVLSSICWTVFSWGFSIYVDRLSDFDMYGSMTTIVVVMLWLYFCMYLFLMGGEINAFLQPLLGLVFVSRRLKKQHEREPEGNVHGDREPEIEKNKKNN